MAIQNKLTAGQYKALLSRSMGESSVAERSSSIYSRLQEDTQGMAIPNEPGVPMEPGGPQGPPPELIPTSADPDPLGMNQPNPAGMTEAMAKAEHAWGQIKGTIGEQLWKQLALTSAETAGMSPDGAFITMATKLMRDPNSVKDARIKEFLKNIVASYQEQTPATTPGVQPTNDLASQLQAAWS